MQFHSSTGLLEREAGPSTGATGLFVPMVDVAALSDDGLSLRLRQIGRGESRLAAMKAQVLAEVGRRRSAGEAQPLARNELPGRERRRGYE